MNALILANIALAGMFIFAIAQALVHHGIGWSGHDVFYYGTTSLSLAVILANIIVLATRAE
jgi:hypothetical protein